MERMGAGATVTGATVAGDAAAPNTGLLQIIAELEERTKGYCNKRFGLKTDVTTVKKSLMMIVDDLETSHVKRINDVEEQVNVLLST